MYFCVLEHLRTVCAMKKWFQFEGELSELGLSLPRKCTVKSEESTHSQRSRQKTKTVEQLAIFCSDVLPSAKNTTGQRTLSARCTSADARQHFRCTVQLATSALALPSKENVPTKQSVLLITARHYDASCRIPAAALRKQTEAGTNGTSNDGRTLVDHRRSSHKASTADEVADARRCPSVGRARVPTPCGSTQTQFGRPTVVQSVQRFLPLPLCSIVQLINLLPPVKITRTRPGSAHRQGGMFGFTHLSLVCMSSRGLCPRHNSAIIDSYIQTGR